MYRSADNLHPARARRQALRLALLATLALAGCAPDETGGGAPGAEPGAPPSTPSAEPDGDGSSQRPLVVEGSILLEGTREPMTYRLFRAPPDFPLQFSTYVPDDMEAEAVRSDSLAALRFVARFGPPGAGEAGVRVMAPARPLQAAEARSLLRAVAEREGAVETAEPRAHRWALEEVRFRGDGGEVGRVALGRHREQFFLVVVRYPAQMGDGMGPRVQRILDEWRWREGGALGS